MKTCTRCKELKPLSDFYKLSASKDGHRTQCKTCSNNYKNKERIEIVKHKRKFQKFLFKDDICRIEIISPKYGLKYSIIDTEDYYKIKDCIWRVCWDPKKKNFYVYGSNSEKNILSLKLQRIIVDCNNEELKVDHINGDTLDNTKSNLRICTNAENSRNSCKISKKSTSKYKGVDFIKKRKKYRVRIKVNYKEISLGYFSDENEAGKVYNEAAIKYFGEFAFLNKVSK